MKAPGTLDLRSIAGLRDLQEGATTWYGIAKVQAAIIDRLEAMEQGWYPSPIYPQIHPMPDVAPRLSTNQAAALNEISADLDKIKDSADIQGLYVSVPVWAVRELLNVVRGKP